MRFAIGGSDTSITASSHGLVVGDVIEILSEHSFGSVTTSHLGTHTVKSVTDVNTFTIELDSSANAQPIHSKRHRPLFTLVEYRTAVPEAFNVPYVQRNFLLDDR